MRGLVITFFAVFFLVGISYSQQVDGFVIQNIKINDSYNNSGVSFYKQNYLVHTMPKKNKSTHDTDFYVSMAGESGNVLEGDLLEGALNSYISEINLTFTTDFKKVYFTRSYIGSNKKEHFDIYIADVTEDNKFINLKMLPFNYRNYSTAYPSLSLDNKTLYFASNRRESLGGFDIFKVAILNNGKRFGKVINLGSNVNTKKDEITPYVLGDKLYFASNGRNGFGKLDVFSYELRTKQKSRNLGETLNSEGDDFGFIRKQHRNYGYFVSDRVGGKGKKDIYYFKVIKIDAPEVDIVEVPVIDEIDEVAFDEGNDDMEEEKNKPIENVVVQVDTGVQQTSIKLKNKIKKESPVEKSVVQTKKPVEKANSQEENKNDLAQVDIEADNLIENENTKKNVKKVSSGKIVRSKTAKPKVIVSKTEEPKEEIVLGESKVVVPVDEKYEEEITYEEKKRIAKNLYDFQRRIAYNNVLEEKGRVLKKRDEFTRKEKNCTDKIERLEDIYFDLNKFAIRPDAQIQINKAIKIMKKCPNIKFVASSYTDSRGSSDYNRKLSQRRATSVVAYILNNSDLDLKRIQGIGYGEVGIKNNCYNGVKCSEKEHQVNRRTEIEVYIYK